LDLATAVTLRSAVGGNDGSRFRQSTKTKS
jgi:hypothetical protein